MIFVSSLKDKYNKLSLQTRASLWFVVCSILQKGISFITIPIFSRIMTKDQFGYYNTYISWYSILLVFTSLSLFYGVFNNAMIKFKQDKRRYVSSMQGLVTTLTMIVFLIYLCAHSFVNALLKMTTPLVLMLFIELLVTPALQFWSAFNRFEFRYKGIVAVTLFKSFANPILGIILVISSDDKATARIISTVLIEVIVCGTIALYQFYKGRCFFDKQYWRYALLFNLPLLPHYLSGQILNQSDRIMISHLVDDAAVAMYGIPYSIAIVMNIFTQAINGSYTPWFYQTVEKKDFSNIKKITNITTLIMVVLIVVLMLFAPEVMDFMGGKGYKEAVYVIPPVAASVLFTFLYNIFANVEFFFEKRKYVLIGSIVAAILNIILNYLFIPLYGYVAAAYTTLGCYIVYCYLHQIMARYICKQKGIPRNIFDTKRINCLSVGVILISIGMNFVYQNNYIRYIIIFFVVIVLLIKRKKLWKIAHSTFQVMKEK